jgi:hypothetical protein
MSEKEPYRQGTQSDDQAVMMVVRRDQFEWLRYQHSPYGDKACRHCLVGDGYSRCATRRALDTIKIESEQAER